MRFTPGVGVVHLHRHLDRLEASARYFAIPFERNEASAAVRCAVRERDGRLRLQLDANGDVTVRIHDLVLGTEPVSLALGGATAVRSDDRSLFHKLTDRRRYDAARAACPDADDVVLHNERGEITETTTANLAISIDGRWWTPALDCGLLPGVERARLIEAGVLAERPIKLGELADAAEIAVINSLRGWRAARIA
jgi:para-aminobenzoate synthetase/4-amino-4-deoxychorismate lyase